MAIAVEKQRTLKSIEEEYDHLFTVSPVRDEDRAYRWFAEQVKKESPATRILDIACGGGYFLSACRNVLGSKAQLTGIDISGKALELAAKECPGARLIQSSAEALPFHSEQFDAITCLGSLEHFPNIEEALNQMRKVSGPDARVFILVPKMFWYKDILSVGFSGNRKTRNQTQEKFASLGEWRELLEKINLKIVKTKKYNGIARSPFKQGLKDVLIPLKFSYHFLFVCSFQ